MMRQNKRTKGGAEKNTLLAATLTCYLACFACLFAFGYSLAALAAPALADSVRAAVERQARP